MRHRRAHGRRSGLSRLRSVLVASALVVAGAGVAVPTLLPRAAADPCARVHPYGNWTTIRLPAYPMPLDSGSDMALYAESLYVSAVTLNPGNGPWDATKLATADLNNPSHRFASNGRMIMSSTDGGCTWSPVFSLDPVNGPVGAYQVYLAGAAYHVVAMAAAGGTGRSPSTVYALIEDDEAGTTSGETVGVSAVPVFVAASPDGGKTWTVLPPGIPTSVSASVVIPGGGVAVHAGGVAVSPQHPGRVYVFVDAPASSGVTSYATVFRSSDAGRSWDRLRGSQVEMPSTALLEGAAVDPSDRNSVWVTECPTSSTLGKATTRVLHSADGGNTWHLTLAASDPVNGSVTNGTVISVLHPRHRPAQVLAWCEGDPAHLSTDGGHRYRSLQPPKSPYHCPGAFADSYNTHPQFIGMSLRPRFGDLIAATVVYECNSGFSPGTQLWRLALPSGRFRMVSSLGLFGENPTPALSDFSLVSLGHVAGLIQPFYGFGGTPSSLQIDYGG